jgi:hypothetical protein
METLHDVRHLCNDLLGRKTKNIRVNRMQIEMGDSSSYIVRSEIGSENVTDSGLGTLVRFIVGSVTRK